MNAHPKKTYYFDIKALIEDYANESSSWIVARSRGKQDPDRKEKNRLIRSDITLDQARADIYIAEYIEDSGDFAQHGKDEMRSLAARVKGVFERLRNYQVPIVTIERDAEIESVCRIFETINSTGTRQQLSTWQLQSFSRSQTCELCGRVRWTISPPSGSLR